MRTSKKADKAKEVEVILKRIFLFITLTIFISLSFGKRVTLVRGRVGQPPQAPLNTNYTLKLITDSGVETIPVYKFQNLALFRKFMPPRQKSTEPLRETKHILALRVEFVEDDDPLTSGNGKMVLEPWNTPDSGLFYDPPHTKTYFERQMQALSNYYKSNSFGNLEVTWTVKPDAESISYQLPNRMRYYCGFDHYDPETGFIWYNVWAREMGLVRILADAIAAADQDETIDFSDYDGVMIFHAGVGWEVGVGFGRFCDLNSVYIPPGALEFFLGKPYILANAGTDTIRECTIDPEMERVDDYMVGLLGTVCHEFGHLVGLPDLYDVYGRSSGVGSWDIMCNGAYAGSASAGAPPGAVPTNLGAWSRYFLGWVTPQTITNPDTTLTVRAAEIDTTQYEVADQTMIKIPISETEFFLIENRQQDIIQKDTIIIDVEDGVPIYVDRGEYDFFLPGKGILIWHIDDNVVDAGYPYDTVQVNPQHKGVDLEEADGIQHFDAWWFGDTLEYFGSLYDPFFVDDSNKANHYFGPLSNPNSDSYFGKSLVTIEVESKNDTLMDFSYKLGIYQSGFPLTVRPWQQIQAVSYGDLDGNGDTEVIVAIKIGSIYAYNSDGSPYGTYTSYNEINTFLSVGDINSDGAEDILFATGSDIVCLDGLTLSPMPNFPFTADNEILSTPLLFDINDDSQNEIIFGSKDRKLYCLDSTGTNIANFPISLSTELVSTPCVFKENEGLVGVQGSNGLFWLINRDGIVKEFTDAKHNMITYASPVVGDMDRDGNPEAVIINGFGTIYIFGEDTLEQWFDILIDTTFYFTPALADLDNDGYLEIIMPNSSKTLFVNNRNGTSENNFPIYYDDYLFHPLLVGDFDDNTVKEIVFGRATLDTLARGQLMLVNNRKKEFEFSPLFGEGGFTSPGVIFDLDADGDLELACGSDFGRLYVWDFPGTSVSWSGYMNSPKNWGRFEGELIQPQVAEGLLGNCYIYPSPVEREGIVRFFLHQEADVTVEILDIVGHEIGSVRVANTTPNEYNEIGFDFTLQSNGVYIVRVEAKNGAKREVKFQKFAILK